MVKNGSQPIATKCYELWWLITVLIMLITVITKNGPMTVVGYNGEQWLVTNLTNSHY